MSSYSTNKQSSQVEVSNSLINRSIGLLGFVVFCLGLLLLRTDFEVIANGTVTREDELTVYAPRTGVVESVNYREGDFVEQGVVIIQLEGDELSLQLLTKRRELAELEYRLGVNKLAIREFEVKPAEIEVLVAADKKRLLTEISSIQDDLVKRWEALERNSDIRTIELQQERINQLRVGLEQLETQVHAQWLESGLQDIDKEKLVLEQGRLNRAIALANEEISVLESEQKRLRIIAPFDGHLTRMDIRHPGRVAMEGQQLFRIANPDSPYVVEALVPERNVDLIRPGNSVRMESEVFNTLMEGKIQGTVIRIAPDAESPSLTDNKPSQFEVEIRVDETPLPLVLGSSLKTYILLGKRSLWDMLLDRRDYEKGLRGDSQEDAS